MAFSDDYTDSESETDESTSVDSEAHSSDLDFLNDDSESEESEDGDSDDDDVELVLENIVSGAIIVDAGGEVASQQMEGTEVAVELLVAPTEVAEAPTEVAVAPTEVAVETAEVSSETLEKPQCTDAMQVDNAAVNPEAVSEDTENIQEPPTKKPRTSRRSTMQTDPSFRTALLNLIQRAI
jgi:hypothetical protein